jgi:hypothetical protein
MTASNSISNSDSALSRLSRFSFVSIQLHIVISSLRQGSRRGQAAGETPKKSECDVSAVAPTLSVTFGSRGGNWQSLGGKRQ